MNRYPPDQMIEITSGVQLEFVFVEGGTFLMRDDSSEYGQPIHEVELLSFYIGKYQVTQKQWLAVMGENPSHFQGEKHPVDSVSWEDVKAFIKKLNVQAKMFFRLPTEAEWNMQQEGGGIARGLNMQVVIS